MKGYTRDGIPRDAREWSAADWRSLHAHIEAAKREIAVSHERTGPNLAHTWNYWRVDADGRVYGPRRTVRFPHPVEAVDAASYAAEQEDDEHYRAEGMHHVGQRAEDADGQGKTLELELPGGGQRRFRVVCRVRFDYSEVRDA